MRYLILADIHSNVEAFRAVLEDAEGGEGYHHLWCLGDIVGYGPDPEECVQLLRSLDPVCVAGNHDWAAVGKLDVSQFNADAAAAASWTAQQLSPESKTYLSGLPLSPQEGDFTLVHGSPRDPIWEYVISTPIARLCFAEFQTLYCLVGHSHIPHFYEHRPQTGDCFLRAMPKGEPLMLGDTRLIINPGSVGQPRDGNPAASYLIYDSEARSLRHYRALYDVKATQQKMRRHGLPYRLIERLGFGW
ncbi:MAG: metallophosphoesterase family protein [Chloroflexi bacterium]|nr:metallophosphoesterase family protein [Chloroflexota bacterium]